MSIPAAASAASIPPSHESLDLLRACECPVDVEPLVHAVTLIPCCHKINQAVAETMYGRMTGESCANRGRPCVLCRAPVIAYYVDPVMRDIAHRALRLAEPRVVAPIAVADAVAPIVEPRVLPARRAAEARADAEPRVVAPRVGVDVVPPIRAGGEVRAVGEEVLERPVGEVPERERERILLEHLQEACVKAIDPIELAFHKKDLRLAEQLFEKREADLRAGRPTFKFPGYEFQ